MSVCVCVSVYVHMNVCECMSMCMCVNVCECNTQVLAVPSAVAVDVEEGVAGVQEGAACGTLWHILLLAVPRKQEAVTPSAWEPGPRDPLLTFTPQFA